MNCHDIRDHLDTAGPDKQPRPDDVVAHLAGCADCTAAAQRADWETALLTALFKPQPLPDQYAEQLVASVRAAAAIPTGIPTATPAPAARATRPRIRWLPLAASIAIVLGGYSALAAVDLVPWPWELFGRHGHPNGAPALPPEPKPSPTFTPAGARSSNGPLRRGLSRDVGPSPINDAAYPNMPFQFYGIGPEYDTVDDGAVSQFAADADSGSYTILRRYLTDGFRPPREAIRVEEILNRFDYGDPEPAHGPLGLTLEGAPSPFRARRHLIRIGLRGRSVATADRLPADLTLVIDRSASMARGDRFSLGLRALRELTGQLRSGDRVGIVTFGGPAPQTLLAPTLVKPEAAPIGAALETLAVQTGPDRTDLAAGLAAGYRMATSMLTLGHLNRVILLSDGLANVGETGGPALARKVASDGMANGITLTCVGVGVGHYNDTLMEQLADRADGRYLYLDRASEGTRAFSDRRVETLQLAARDVTIRVTFNPKTVQAFRLIGYENRQINGEAGKPGPQDGGEIGAGQTVTALYEILLLGGPGRGDPLADVRINYRDPMSGVAGHLDARLNRAALADSFGAASRSLRWTAMVAELCDRLRESPSARNRTVAALLPELKAAAKAYPKNKEVMAFVEMIETARALGLGPAGEETE